MTATAEGTRLVPSFFESLDRRIAAARADGIDVIDVSKGNPDLPTPPHIVAAMQRAVADPANHSYPAFAPRPALAEAIVRRYRADHGVDLDPDAQLAVFHGSHEGLIAATLALTGPGATVVIPDPGYPVYTTATRLAGARIRHLPLNRDDYQPDFTALAGLDEAALLVLNYPHNPTGATVRPGTFPAAAAESARLGAVFVHDFAYGALGFDGAPVSALTADVSHTVEISTLSKTYSMAGWRVGYAAGSADAIAAMRTYQSHAFSTVFGAVQDAATAALSGDQSAVTHLVDMYRRRRDLVVTALREQGWDIVVPEGGFFVWMDLHGADDEEFATRMLQNHGVAVAPGSGFGSRGRGFTRLSLVHPDERLRELIARLAAARRSSASIP